MEQMLRNVVDTSLYLEGKIEWYKLEEKESGKDCTIVINELEHILEMCRKGMRQNLRENLGEV